ncbi:hypothetical protein KRX52_04455 [Pseudomonas sp. MAP12]|uniref:DUF7210 domain-containing protein n=1 Tax=Geopseudomonas aromaticivorans TaxID=2849492 RepID=A0ABS6MTA6_9GAMM|nr:hypothetical protein [Pseudomonas aromaticivorans]MBV2132048.1 hypothetical protein [Pseudomonas aromaticivorans]
MPATTSAQSGAISVVLAKPHTHNGRAHQPGETITVSAEQKAWLEKLGVVGGKKEEVTNG